MTSLSTHTYDTGNDQDHSRTPLSGVNECVDMVMAKGSFTVLADKTPLSVTDIDLDLRELKSNGSYPAFFAASLGVYIVDTITDEGGAPTAFNLSMKRYGHGCGLSQRGAEQRAKSIEKGGGGQTYQEILQFYYPETTVATQAYTRPALTAVSTPDHTNASVRLTDSTPLNVRTGPGTSYSKLGNLPDNARIEVVQTSAAAGNGYTWHKILFAGQYAYVVVNNVLLDDPQPTPEACTVKFVSNSGSAVPDWTDRHGDNIAAAPFVSRTGYSFSGWYTDSALTAKASFPFIVTGNTSLYAKWLTLYSITYNLNGGTASNPTSYTANDTITLNTPTKSGYIFSGWTGTGLSAASASVTIPKGSAGNRAYTANWTTNVKSAYLARIGLSAGSLNKSFSKTSYSYKIKLGENQSSVTLTPVKEYSGATMKIVGKSVSSYTVSLSNGKSKTIKVQVKYGRTTKTYRFTVTRAKSTNNNLATLTASAGTFDKAFSASVTSYTLTLGENTKSTTIKDTVATSLAKATFKSKKVTLSNGQTKVVKLTVKAQSGAKKTYTIKVTRAKSTNTGLKYLKTNSKKYPLSPAYSAGTTNYTITLPVNKSSVTISAKALGYKAAVYFNGAKKSSKKIKLQAGQSTVVAVKVVAQSGASKTFTVTVQRLISSDATLKTLKASGLSPRFSPGVTNYTIALAAKNSSATISASANGYGAAVYFDGVKKSSKKVTLSHGQSVTVHISVKAQAGNTKDYYVTVTRP